jgi:hypothetical protein
MERTISALSLDGLRQLSNLGSIGKQGLHHNTKIVLTACASPRLSIMLSGRQQQSSQRAQNKNDDQEFNQPYSDLCEDDEPS